MNKKALLIFAITLIFITPVFADYNPLSEEPITDIEEFHRQGETKNNQESENRSYFDYDSKNNEQEKYQILDEHSYQDIDTWEDSNIEKSSQIKETSEKQETANEPTPEKPPENVKPTKNYSQIYNSLEIPTHSYMHNIDPDQYYDMKDASWSPYPLLRLNSPIYFKSITIEPGYYLLTPREHKGKWYLLFKQNGNVAHIIPVYERDITPEFFYDKHLAKPKLTPSQKVHMGFLDFLGKFDSTKRKEPIKSYMEINDLENHFLSIIIYYGNHKYSTIFRSVKL